MNDLVKCPNCGVEVENPVKSWVFKSGRAKTMITMGLFLCPKCNNKFKAGIK